MLQKDFLSRRTFPTFPIKDYCGLNYKLQLTSRLKLSSGERKINFHTPGLFCHLYKHASLIALLHKLYR